MADQNNGVRMRISRVVEKFYRVFGKRALDVIVAQFALVISFIPMVVIALLVKLTSRGCVIFKQERIGRGGKPFVCYKFRSMVDDAPHDMSTSEFTDCETYITPLGRFLRRTSLDELPQIINVLRGDMSLVGARPLISKEKEMHDARKSQGIYELRPGITGLAQVQGRDMISDTEKLRYDLEYCRRISFLFDLKILFKTVFKTFSGADISTK